MSTARPPPGWFHLAPAHSCCAAFGGSTNLLRPPRPDLAPDAALPDDTRLWAALQQAGGGTWSGFLTSTAS